MMGGGGGLGDVMECGRLSGSVVIVRECGYVVGDMGDVMECG